MLHHHKCPSQTRDEMSVIHRNYCDLEYYSLCMNGTMTYTALLLKSNLKYHITGLKMLHSQTLYCIKHMRIKLGNGKANNEFY